MCWCCAAPVRPVLECCIPIGIQGSLEDGETLKKAQEGATATACGVEEC